MRAYVCAQRHTRNLRNINNKENYRSHLLLTTEAGKFDEQKEEERIRSNACCKRGIAEVL